MSDRPFLTIENSKQYVVQLLFDKGVEHNGKYGVQVFYAVTYNGEEGTIAAKQGSILDNALGAGHKGDTYTIEKRRDPKTGYYPFHVEKGDTTTQSNESPTQTDKAYSPVKTYDHEYKDWDVINGLKSHDIHKQTILKAAIASMPRVEKDLDIKEIAKRYFALLNLLEDNLEPIMMRLQGAKNIYHLSCLWQKYSRLWSAMSTPEEVALIKEEKNRLKKLFLDAEEAKNPTKQEAPVVESESREGTILDLDLPF
jgi:hypothetical protein